MNDNNENEEIEIETYIQDMAYNMLVITNQLRDIRKYVKFFYILSIIGIIATIYIMYRLSAMRII